MPKSRPRKRDKWTKVKLDPPAVEILKEQEKAFRRKFGRDPEPNDPIFFDPNADEPKPMSLEGTEDEVLAAMNKMNLPPAFAYAYRKTGLIGVKGMMDAWPADSRKEWNDAVKEYFLIEEASKQPDRPTPDEWNTQIPELLVSPFTRQDLAQVHECLRAIAPIEARGMTMIARIELAATLLAHARELGYEGGLKESEPGYGPVISALAEDLIVRRARELYASLSSPPC